MKKPNGEAVLDSKGATDHAELEQSLDDIRAAYRVERANLLQRQEAELEAARARVKRRDGFSTLTADQAHQVLRTLAEAARTTDEEAIAPTLVSLRDTARPPACPGRCRGRGRSAIAGLEPGQRSFFDWRSA